MARRSRSDLSASSLWESNADSKSFCALGSGADHDVNQSNMIMDSRRTHILSVAKHCRAAPPVHVCAQSCFLPQLSCLGTFI